jgi:hypothetical protein
MSFWLLTVAFGYLLSRASPKPGARTALVRACAFLL